VPLSHPAEETGAGRVFGGQIPEKDVR
jgi:hypothetical protein